MERYRKAIDPAGDPEELHDFRVCLRRIRTLFAEIELSPDSPSTTAELKWLGRVSGKARDFDVQARDLGRTLHEECARYRGAHPLIESRIEERRLDSHRGLRDALASKRYARLVRRVRSEIGAAIAHPPSASGGDHTARTPPGAAALYRKALRQGRKLGPHATDEKFHRLRKTIKKLRYLLDARSAARPRARTEGGIRSLKDMQSVLGDINDLSVQRTLLEALRAELAAEVGDPSDAVSCIDALLESTEKRSRDLKSAYLSHYGALQAVATRRSLLGCAEDAGDRR